MQVVRGFQQFTPPASGIVLSIGNFDGVHRGHAALLARAHAVGQRLGAPIVAMTFDPHPLAVLAPERMPALLVTLDEKLALLDAQGVDTGIVQPCDRSLLTMEADDFLASLVSHCRPRAFVEGPDFRFGRARQGSSETLEAHATRWRYEVHVVPAVHCEDLPTHPTISSTSIRQALRDGRIEEARAMLGRPYRVVGRTGAGEGRGEALGFPTVNLEGITHLLPQEAVYAAVAQLEDDTLHLAAVNIGPQPTFEQEQLRVEAFILDFEGDLRGRRVGLHFLKRLREQQKFPGPDALIEQIARDVAATRALAGELDGLHPISLG